ncbi:hypothetical protein M501DRAFT_981458 [Patellaria atrata CBS 101060]|uniref:Pleckstrin homology domain-containing protein n=1 Tax=Patellaria atrata CBS 101060 TaxID=1346257 RepID=A0A9P4S5V4_9PEZI|nr:hypothetical protein M501DRAFT_981458 [Patellaria atrata CBS 101060]
MAADYFQDQSVFSSLHDPSASPNLSFHTPMVSSSRRSSRHGLSSSPASEQMQPETTQNDENISVLDPRRFTPTLHANLVSEILSLRRELDSKHVLIEDLETNLHSTKLENDDLNKQLSQSTKENKSARLQMQQLETETLAALEELAKERDDINNVNSELKDKLETAQNKIRSLDEDSGRTQNIWEKDKDKWDREKRQLERRVHVTESRLKMVLEELAAQQALQEHGIGSEGEDNTHDSGLGNESDTNSIRSMSRRGSGSRNGRHTRNMSNSSVKSIGRLYRHSHLTGSISEAPERFNGQSLADELRFDEEDEELEELELDSDDFPEHEMRAIRALESRQSNYQDEKAKRILGLMHDKSQTNNSIEEERSKSTETTMTRDEAVVSRQAVIKDYVDSSSQYSPPPSPQLSPEQKESLRSYEQTALAMMEVEANQRRKRIAAAPFGNIRHASPPRPPKTGPPMVSAASQTVEEPLSPPATPKPFVSSPPSAPLSDEPKPSFCSVSTQTDISEHKTVPENKNTPPMTPTRAPPPIPINIPSIAIHPPLSAPPSPGEAILPPGTKNASCQTSSELLPVKPMRSIAVQTEEIRVDRRLAKLPPHLLPSAISSIPPTPTSELKTSPKELGKSKVSDSALKKSPIMRLTQDIPSSPPVIPKSVLGDIEDVYPGNNDNGPLSRHINDTIRRPFRTSSLFAGFDGPSSDEEDQAEDPDLSDEEYRAAPPIPPMASSRGLKHSRGFANPPTPVPEEKEVSPNPRHDRRSFDKPDRESFERPGRNSFDKPAKVAKPLRISTTARQPSVRRTALIQSGAVAHLQHRSRSPSLGSVESSNVNSLAPKPPFPVPTRSSSRRVPVSKSEGSYSPTPRGGGTFRGGRPNRGARHSRQDSLRKVRSAVVIPRTVRQRSRSPPLPSPLSPLSPESPQLPPLPKDSITSSHYVHTSQRIGHRSQPSTNTSNTGQASVNSAGSTSVVDAIAATMVGEWMWKYVRRRKSFGVPDSPQDFGRTGEDGSVNVTGSGVRHKRWVWLSPYERSVMWSSKQPTSGSALLGKTGRKLTIQSVLDVKDDTPFPKGTTNQQIFNRSILILTPARALKFTAVSRERHYLWLKALSFLAQAAPELDALPPPIPPPEHEIPSRSQGASLRRAPIRDSVRLAKDKRAPSLRHYSSRADTIQEGYVDNNFPEPVVDAAEPPTVPRFGGHGRKRSMTQPRMPQPPLPFRSFSHNQVPSVVSNGSSDIYAPPSVPSSLYNGSSAFPASSTRTSEASSAARPNFFDAVGTVRMEAFVESRYSEESGPRKPPRRRNSQFSGISDPNRGGGVYETAFLDFDPFKGF